MRLQLYFGHSLCSHSVNVLTAEHFFDEKNPQLTEWAKDY